MKFTNLEFSIFIYYDAILKIAKIRSGYEQAQNNYTLAKYNYDSAILYAPFDGLIANLNIKEYNQPGADPFVLWLIIKESRLYLIFWKANCL